MVILMVSIWPCCPVEDSVNQPAVCLERCDDIVTGPAVRHERVSASIEHCVCSVIRDLKRRMPRYYAIRAA